MWEKGRKAHENRGKETEKAKGEVTKLTVLSTLIARSLNRLHPN